MSAIQHHPPGNLGAPPPPEVTRLNRNVLLVAVMGVGVVVLAVTHVARNDRRVAAGPAAPPVEAGAMPRFLEEPVSRGESPVPPPAYPEDTAEISEASGGSVQGSGTGSFTAATYDSYPVVAEEPPLSPREEAYQRALRAGLRGKDQRTLMPRTADLGREFGGYAADPYAELARSISATPTVESGLSVPREVVPGVASGATPSPDRHQAFLAAAAENQPPTYIASRLQDPISPYQIMAGTLLPAMLVMGINSDLPGDILAQITRDVYDSQQRFLIIPRGTKVIGSYDDQIALGQSRALIAWTRLIFPDGRSLSLPGLPTQDLRGAAGLRDKVDNHYGRLYGQATLLSIIGAGAQLSQPQQSSVLTPASPGQVVAGAIGQELSAVSMETIRRSMDVRPTLEVRPGTPFYIFLERDLVFDGAYADAG